MKGKDEIKKAHFLYRGHTDRILWPMGDFKSILQIPEQLTRYTFRKGGPYFGLSAVMPSPDFNHRLLAIGPTRNFSNF